MPFSLNGGNWARGNYAEIELMNDRFSQDNSKIIRAVADESPIAIDLARPEG